MGTASTREWVLNELQTDPELNGMDQTERIGALLCRHENAAHAAEKAGDNPGYLREVAGTRLLQLMLIDSTMHRLGYRRRKNGPGDWIPKK